jgi:hypothetical protein
VILFHHHPGGFLRDGELRHQADGDHVAEGVDRLFERRLGIDRPGVVASTSMLP